MPELVDDHSMLSPQSCCCCFAFPNNERVNVLALTLISPFYKAVFICNCSLVQDKCTKETLSGFVNVNEISTF